MPLPSAAREPHAIIEGDRVRLRRIKPKDRSALTAILAQPGVARWWSPGGPEEAVKQLYGKENVAYVIEVDGQIAGAISYAEKTEPDSENANVDIFLADSYQGHGLGPDAIRALARHLLELRGHHRLTIDPALTNAAAIRAYEKVGFHRVGILRAYERGPDGTWHDNLLMDLLLGELK
jgi:aminoglycoside 6'-N-acetyltransferase